MMDDNIILFKYIIVPTIKDLFQIINETTLPDCYRGIFYIYLIDVFLVSVPESKS